MRKKNFMEEPLHSQFVKKTEEMRNQETWKWLKKKTLKKETGNAISCLRLYTKDKQYQRQNW